MSEIKKFASIYEMVSAHMRHCGVSVSESFSLIREYHRLDMHHYFGVKITRYTATVLSGFGYVEN